MKNLFLLFLLSVSCFTSSSSLYGQQVSQDLLLGKVNYTDHNDFTAVDQQYATRPMFLEKETYRAFLEMQKAAQDEGIQLKIVSGARNFEHQKAIWERKWNNLKNLQPIERADKILEFSSMPSTSRHHWGTDIDLNSLENEFFDEGEGKEIYDWLIQNASRYGFYQVYDTKSQGRTGYAEEKWHWSYLPVANHYLQRYNELVTYRDIEGFEGAQWAEEKRMISDYVNGISRQPQPVRLAAAPSTSTKK